MDKIKVLEDIGLKKVSEETHIEQKYIKYMVDCDFEKLNRINTLGFVKILTRAYNIDLDAWSEAFEEYWAEAHKDDKEKELFVVVADKKQSRKLLNFIIFVIVIATFSFLFALFQDKINLDNYINEEETSFEQPSIVENAQKTLDEINSSIVEEEIVVEDKIEEVIEDINQTETIETVDKVEEINEVKVVEINATESKEVIEEKVDEVVVELPKVVEKSGPRFENEAIITPNTKLWIGVIYLDTKKRRSYMGEGNFSIDISRDQIITTGHGSLNITQDGTVKEFKRQAPLRFLVRDNNITEIDWSRYKELNEGKSW